MWIHIPMSRRETQLKKLKAYLIYYPACYHVHIITTNIVSVTSLCDHHPCIFKLVCSQNILPSYNSLNTNQLSEPQPTFHFILSFTTTPNTSSEPQITPSFIANLWKKALIKFGVDLRAGPEFRNYQIVTFEMNFNPIVERGEYDWEKSGEGRWYA